jgi:transposase
MMFAEFKAERILADRKIEMSDEQRIAAQEALRTSYEQEEVPADFSMKMRAQGIKMVGGAAIGGYIGSQFGEVTTGAAIGLVTAVIWAGNTAYRATTPAENNKDTAPSA